MRGDLHFTERILESSTRTALTIDLTGYTITPTLVNAHDHLELNHFPRTKFRDNYGNAHQWGEDVSSRLDDAPYKDLRAYSLKDRCFIGGLKNLLSGATIVIHHNPPHKLLFKKSFPVRVFKNYGWTHSLHFSTDAEIQASYQQTPKDHLWCIHLAEGIDATASSEYQRLKTLGCINANTLLIHGVGLTESDVADCAPIIKGLVICPTTNRYLLDALPDIASWLDHGGRLFIGSDSRLTADGDLVDEIAYLTQSGYFGDTNDTLLNINMVLSAYQLVTSLSPLSPTTPADFIIEPDWQYRHGHGLIVKGGVPQIGNPDLMALFPHIDAVPATLDGALKAVNIHLARQIARCTLQENGLNLLEAPRRKRLLF